MGVVANDWVIFLSSYRKGVAEGNVSALSSKLQPGCISGLGTSKEPQCSLPGTHF